MKTNFISIFSSKITISILILCIIAFASINNAFAENYHLKNNFNDMYYNSSNQQQQYNNYNQSSNYQNYQNYPNNPYSTTTYPANQNSTNIYSTQSPSPADFHALMLTLTLIDSDLQMCEHSIRANNNYINNLMTIGYVNNAKSALSKSNIHPAYYSLLSEIDKRLSKVKFHLVMNDKMNSLMMISQLRSIIRNIIAKYIYTHDDYSSHNSNSNQMYYLPPTYTNSNQPTYYPSLPPISINYSNGQNFTPPSANLPVNLIPTSDSY